MATKHTARDKFLALVHASGWELDPSRTVYLNRWSEGKAQDPFAFVKAAAHGGTWHIYLDYLVRSNYCSTIPIGNTLRKVVVGYRDADGNPKRYGSLANIGILANPSKWAYGTWLWQALGVDSTDSLRVRAERLITDPDLAVWLAIQAHYDDNERDRVRREAQSADRKARSRPLPVTVSQGEYDSEWEQRARRAQEAANEVGMADGASNLPALVAELVAATAAVEAALVKAEVAV